MRFCSIELCSRSRSSAVRWLGERSYFLLRHFEIPFRIAIQVPDVQGHAPLVELICWWMLGDIWGCWKFSLTLYILLSSIFCRYSWYFDLRIKSILSTYWLGRYDYTTARRAGQCFIESHSLPTRWRISNQSSYDGWDTIRNKSLEILSERRERRTQIAFETSTRAYSLDDPQQLQRITHTNRWLVWRLSAIQSGINQHPRSLGGSCFAPPIYSRHLFATAGNSYIRALPWRTVWRGTARKRRFRSRVWTLSEHPDPHSNCQDIRLK